MVQHFLVKHPVHIPDVHAAAGAVQKIIFASSNKTYKKRSCLIMYTVHTVHTSASEPHLYGDEDHDHPLQPQTVFLTQVAPH